MPKYPDHKYIVLPPGIHDFTEEDFYMTFCRRRILFRSSQERYLVARKYAKFRRLIKSMIASQQWVGGSFVESKPNPSDVDVVVWADIKAFERLTEEQRRCIMDLCDWGRKAYHEYATDAVFCVVVDETDPCYGFYCQNWKYWRKWFGATRSGNPKGFVRLCLKDVRGNAAPLVPAPREVENE